MHRFVNLTLGIVLCLFAQPSFLLGEALTFYVATNGNDAWSGRAAEAKENDGPFRTIERARNAIRALKQNGSFPKEGVVVEIAGGLYEQKTPLTLSAEDSGVDGGPIVYRAKKGEQVRITGGQAITGWQPVTDPAVLAKLDESARGKVYQAELKVQGVTDFGEMKSAEGWAHSEVPIELFFEQKPMTLARWPNQGFVKIPKLLGTPPSEGDRYKEGIFTYDGDRPARWVGQPDVMLHGYWSLDWADQRLKVESIDAEKRVITLPAKPGHAFGYRVGQWYYAYNLLCELDSPGEWYLDRTTGILYFWPTAPIEQGNPTLSILPSVVVMDGATNLTIAGLLFEYCRDTAIIAKNAVNDRFVGCTFRNIGQWAIYLQGRDSIVVGCDIYDTGSGGLSLIGGDRNTLTPGNLIADNNHIHHYSRWNRVYKPGISLKGVGNVASHNLIDNAPHEAIEFYGNDHLIEYNEIHSACYESNDAGAIYSGRDWSCRGTIIRFNHFHDISGFEGRGCVGVYFDDQLSGNEIRNNVFHNVTRAAMIGGGRDCAIVNNIFVNCVPAIHIDDRGLNWAAGPGAYGEKFLHDRLVAVPYQDPAWAAKYPKLVNILDDEPMAPKGNIVARNIHVGTKWGDLIGKGATLPEFKDNLLDQDPLFVDAEHGDFRLKDDSPALKLGFEQLPFNKMGLYESPDRATWPVEHTVRLVGKPQDAK